MTAMAVLTEESVEKLAAVLDRVCEKDPAALSDGDTIEALHHQLARLEAATARAAAAFDVARGWEADGARSAAAWISTRCRRPLGEARRRVAAGRRLRDMPQVDAAWTAGDISASHVDVLGRAWTPASAQLFARDEQLLCEEARQLRFHHFVQVVAYWRYRADPDGVEADAAASATAAGFTCRRVGPACGSSTACWTPSAGPSWKRSWPTSRTSCSDTTGPRPPPGAANTPGPATPATPATSGAPRRSGGLMRWSRWLGGRPARRPVPACWASGGLTVQANGRPACPFHNRGRHRRT